MFYTHILLGKHGSLSKIWIAAHWQKKLTRSNISECNLETAIRKIISPKTVISLRILGHLLLGVVRVYNRKTKYLLADCNEALLKMRMTFQPGLLDLSVVNQEAAYNAITLQEEFYDFDMQLPDLNQIDVVDHFTLNQSRVQDITMRDDYSHQQLLHDSFGDLDPLRQDFPKEHSFELSGSGILPEHSSLTANEDGGDFLVHDGFGDEGSATDFFANNQLFMEFGNLAIDVTEVTMPVDLLEEQHLGASLGDSDQMPPPKTGDYATLLNNEAKTFILEPVDVTEIEKRKKGKRKLMIDKYTQIPTNSFRKHLGDFSDTITSPRFARNARSAMEWQMTGEVQWLLSQPTQPTINPHLISLITQPQRSAAAKRPQEKPAQHEVETLRQAPEDQDLPQLKDVKMTDVSSASVDESSEGHEPTDPMRTVAWEDISMQEERSDLPENSFAASLPENMEQTESTSDSEELRCNKRSQEMLRALQRMNQSGIGSFSFQELCKGDKRKRVSAKFYSLLVLKKQCALRTVQSSPFSDIVALPGARFHTL